MKNTFILLVILFSCTPKSPPVVKIMQQNSGTTESYRGLSVVNATTAWISGTNGSVLRTKNAGASWENVSIPGADSIDFRDIEAFSDDTAIVISAGSPGLIYKTTDGGINWQEVYKDDRPEIFFDAMGFWDSQSGIAFSDAINGKIILVKTDDGGDSWQQLSNDLLPDALDHEGGFAASGTCLITLGDSVVMIALGTPRSRFMKSNNRGIDWEIVETPMVQEVAGAGIFSIAFSTIVR